MSEQQESMHDELSKAFDVAESSEPVDAPAIETAVEIEPVQTEIPSGNPVAGEVQPHDPATPGIDLSSEPATTKAPQSWGVTEREGWGSLSPEIQNQINKREAETQQALTHSGEARKFQEEFQQTVNPYMGFIQAEGGTPMTAFSNLMQTAATLQAGAPQQKATRIAELINHYGIDIQMLDTILSGQTPQNGEDARLGDMLDQRLQPMMQTLNQFEQSQQYAQQETKQQQNLAIDEFFAGNEFASDVKFEMADLMEMAGKRGQTLELQGAYEKALLLRPDIQQVIQQRTAAANAQTGNQQIQQKSRAAVSVPGGDAMQGGTPKPDNMRDAIIAAMDR